MRDFDQNRAGPRKGSVALEKIGGPPAFLRVDDHGRAYQLERDNLFCRAPGYTDRRTIAPAMKYCDKAQFGRDRTPGDPQQFHSVNSLV